MEDDRPQGVRVHFEDGRRPLPLDVSWAGLDDEGLSLWVASCPAAAFAALEQGTAHVRIDVLPARTAMRLVPRTSPTNPESCD